MRQDSIRAISDTPDIMKIGEAARYLRIGKTKLYRLAQEGKVPCTKLGNEYRFKQTVLDEWLRDVSRSSLQATGAA